jgi:hypothetical protein
MATIQDLQMGYVRAHSEYGKEFVDLNDMTPTTRRQFSAYLRGKLRPTTPGYENTAFAMHWYMWLGYRQGLRRRR